jgi:hypothetical protein
MRMDRFGFSLFRLETLQNILFSLTILSSRGLLHSWEIDSSSIDKTLPHDRMNLLKLERLEKSILNLVFGNNSTE